MYLMDPQKMDQSVDHDDILIDIVCVLYGDARNQVKLEQPLRWWSVACEKQEEKKVQKKYSKGD